MMAVIKNKIVQIALLAFFGVLFIAGYHISKAIMMKIPLQMIADNCGTSIRMIESITVNS